FAEGHIFLAKAYLDGGSNLDEAARLARKGLELHPSESVAPLGHYVLADIFSRQGRPADSAREAALGRSLEGRKDTKDAKDAKDTKDPKDTKDAKGTKEQKKNPGG